MARAAVNLLLFMCGELIVIGIAASVVMWIAGRDQEEEDQQ